MSCAPGKSIFLGLLLAAFALISTSCQNLSSSDTGKIRVNDASKQRVKLLVEKDGMFAVSIQDLVQSGLAISEMSTSQLNLSQEGLPVPYLIQDDRLIFYGQAPQSQYTNVRPYILEIDQKGSAIQSVDVPDLSTPLVTGIPQTIRLEENHIYKAEARNKDEDDVWFWTELSQGNTFDTQANIPYATEEPAQIRINSWGHTDLTEVEEDHSYDLLVNGEFVGSAGWDGQVHHIGEMSLPAGTLKRGINGLTIDNRPEGASFLDIMHINWLEIKYQAPAFAIDDRLDFSAVAGLVQMSGFSDEPLILNVNNGANPELLTGWEYENDRFYLPVSKDMTITAVGPGGFYTPTIEAVRESDWRNPEQQADLLVVTTDELSASLAPLLRARQEQGLSTALVPVDEIYDEFGHGENSPESIRKFVTYAYTHWQDPQPRYLFLVGDATTDFLSYASKPPANVVPTFMVPVQYSGETASDSRLADIDGDLRPDMAVGRWPVRTKQEVEDLVDRTLAYERGVASKNVIFAADDSEVRFRNIAERVAKNSQIPEEQVQHLDNFHNEDSSKQIFDESWLATYVGHGSMKQWGKEDILDLESVASLQSSTPPIIIQLTCLTGLFAHPHETSLVEAMLTQPGGPVISVAATSLTLSGHQEPFAIQLLQRMQDSNIIRIGDAFQAAKLSLEIEKSNGLREISDTFVLFGDPSTSIARP